VETKLFIDGEVQSIYIQLHEQRELYVKYGEVIQIDGAYRLPRTSLPASASIAF